MTHDAVADTDEDATVVVERPAPPDNDATVVVDRPPARRDSPPEEPDTDRTVVVERVGAATGTDSGAVEGVGTPAPDDTVVVDRTGTGTGTGTSDPDADRTVVVDRTGTSAPDRTVAIDREPSTPSERARRDRLVVRGRIPAARAPKPAPIDPALQRPARLAPGPGIIDHYQARPAPEPSPAPETASPPEGIPRADSSALPSVARHSRRLAGIGLLAVAAACVVSVAGLAWIILSLLGA